jgi:hypothetical protein
MSFHNVILKSNAFQMIKAVNDIEQNWNRFGQLVEDIRMIFNLFTS